MDRDIDVDVNIDADIEVDVDTGLLLWLFKGGSKVSSGTVHIVLTLIILKRTPVEKGVV